MYEHEYWPYRYATLIEERVQSAPLGPTTPSASSKRSLSQSVEHQCVLQRPKGAGGNQSAASR